MVAVLGLRHSLLSASASTSVAGETEISESSDDARREFYGDFLVPRFAATAAMARGGCRSVRFREDYDGVAESKSPAMIALQELVRLHLVESGKR